MERKTIRRIFSLVLAVSIAAAQPLSVHSEFDDTGRVFPAYADRTDSASSSEQKPETSEPEGKFVTRGGKTRYRYSSGERSGEYAKGLTEINGKQYFFDEDGVLAVGQWVELSGTRYYASEDGSFLTGKQNVEGTDVYFDQSGAERADGWFCQEGSWYYICSGRLQTGWLSFRGNWYYLDADGRMLASEWVENGGKWYYLKESGKMAVSEWVQWKDHWYHVGKSGQMQTGTLTLSGRKWYFDGSGRLTVDNDHPIDVPLVLQAPALPNGCEITALTELLRFYGFGVSHTEMAKTYLPRAKFTYSGGKMYGPDPDEYFVGNPEDKTGWYCLEGPILTAANRYLSEQGSTLRAKKISGADVEELQYYLKQGIPVMVWETPFLNEFSYSSVRWTLPDGTLYKPYAGTHGLVLTSIDEEQGIATFSDPAKGKNTQKLDFFLRLYRAMGRRAVIIQ